MKAKYILKIMAGAATLALSSVVLNAAAPDLVLIGNAGNSADPNTGSKYGSVDYEYSIGKTEVTNAQYAEFLNATASSSDPYGLYNTYMGSYAHGGIIRSGSDGNFTYSVKEGAGNNAVNYVSLYDAARFCNWLTTGDVNSGGYIITGSGSTGGILRNENWDWSQGGFVLPTEDEWYKAAYYNPETGTYSKYSNGKDTISPTDANYRDTGINTITDVDFGTESLYGTLGQDGNVWEWTQTVTNSAYNDYGVRGGACDSFTLGSGTRDGYIPGLEERYYGFRVVYLEFTVVPEPSTYAAIFGAVALGFVAYRRKKK